MVGKKLKLLREEKGETIAEAAEGIGVKKSSLRAYESGRKTPGDNVLEKFAKYYGVSEDFISEETLRNGASKVGGGEKLCPLKIKEVKHPKTGDTTRWFLPCLKDKCMAYGKDGSCKAFSVSRQE